MKRIIKLCIYILIFPFLVLINPITIKFVKSIKGLFCGLYNNLFFSHTLFKLHCPYRIDCSEGVKGIELRGRLAIGYGNRIASIERVGRQIFDAHLIFGDNVYIGNYNHIACINKISIGNNVMIASHVFMEDHSHGGSKEGYEVNDIPKVNLPIVSKGPIIIEDNVWIGENVCILPNVHIGKNSVIGAGSVVTHDVEPNSVYAGNPARKIK